MRHNNNKKTIMIKMSLVLCRWGIVAGLIAMPILAFPAETIKTEASTRSPATKMDESNIRIDLDIVEGGIMGKTMQEDRMEANLGNIAQAWRNQLGINMVLPPGLANTRIADLKLRRASLSDALQALMVAGNHQFSYQIMKQDPSSADATTLVTFMARPQPKLNVEVFNLTPYFRSAGILDLGPDSRQKHMDEALDEIKNIAANTISRQHNQAGSGIGMQHNVVMPSINFHRGANLLVITGTEDHIDVIRKIVKAMNQEPSEEPARR